MLLDSDKDDLLRRLDSTGDDYGLALLYLADGGIFPELVSHMRSHGGSAALARLSRAEWQGLADLSSVQAQAALLIRQKSLRLLTYERHDEQVIADLVECCWNGIEGAVGQGPSDLEDRALAYLEDAQGPLGVSPVEVAAAARLFAYTATEMPA